MEKNFRDRLTTVDSEGKRKWIYPKKPSGKFYNLRSYSSYLMIAFLFALPFVEYKGHPFILLNVLERKFILFGQVFWPQDFYIIVFIFLTAVVFIILFTVIFGRFFCGWICPQTIFMEMIFRKIEFAIEGDFNKQKALDNQEWNAEKILKKGSKHLIFYGISVIISNVFLAYLIGKNELFKIINEPVSEHTAGFTTLVIFSGVFYWIFASFREQVCTIACPYGRLQGVLLDNKSVVVAYDFVRGEPRGILRKNEERNLGDCIDCKQCVQVCPTGIDIRNGTQLECINCTACIDACDAIMLKVNKPTGLIRYDSMEGIETGKKFTFNTRIVAYSIVLVAMILLGTYLLFSRSVIDTTILRSPGTLYVKVENNNIRNVFNIKIINKTFNELPVEIKLLSHKGKIQLVGGELSIPSDGLAETVMIIDIEKNQLKGINTKIEIGIFANNELIETIKTKFLAPNN